MGSSVEFLKPGESLQRLQTTYRVFTDRHGRKFGAQCDIRNQMPKEELHPVGFTPPWVPPMRFAKFATDGTLTFWWDYSTMAMELSGDAASYYQEVTEFAIDQNMPLPELGGPVDKKIRLVKGQPPLSPAIPLACEQGDPWMLGMPGAAVNETLKEVLFQGVQSNSKAALEIIRKSLADTAARAATPLVAARPEPETAKAPEIVKRTTDVDVEAMPEITYQQFVAECRGRKMKLPEIAAMWQEHKRMMKENATVGAK